MTIHARDNHVTQVARKRHEDRALVNLPAWAREQLELVSDWQAPMYEAMSLRVLHATVPGTDPEIPTRRSAVRFARIRRVCGSVAHYPGTRLR